MRELERLENENASSYAYRVILHNILTLEFPPGSMVSENDLSERLNISRTPVREALLEIRHLDLVESFPQKGSYVTKIDYKRIEDADFIRLSLETAIVRLACRDGLSVKSLKKLKENVEKQKKCILDGADNVTMLELDNMFHKLLFEAVQKEQAYEFMQAQMVHFDRLRNLSYLVLKEEKYSRNTRDHEEILDAINRRDDHGAEKLMIRHLTHHLHEREKLEACCPEYFLI